MQQRLAYQWFIYISLSSLGWEKLYWNFIVNFFLATWHEYFNFFESVSE